MRIISDSCNLIRTINTGHIIIHGIDFSYDGTLMLTCGEDLRFKIWNISGINLATTAPPMIENVSIGGIVWTCRFSSTNLVLAGNSNGNIKIYGPTYTNLLRTYNPTASGQVNSAEFFYCENSTKIVMGSENGISYWYNGTSTASTIALN